MATNGKKHIVDKAYLQNRPLTAFEKMDNFLQSNGVIIFFPMSLFWLIANPFFFLVVAPFAYYFIKGREVDLPKMPFFFPASSGVKKDPFNPDPAKRKDGSKRYREAKGIVYFGNETENNLQCWFDNGTVRQHCSFLAATGSGKTFTMIGIFNVNSLIFGAGYCLVDGKADLDLAHKEISLLWRFNRLDDFFLINYIQGDTNPWDEYQGHLTTNTFNILDTGTAQSCIESFKSLMDGDGDIWAKRGDALVSGLLGPLVYLRDERIQFLNMGTMLDYLTVESAGLLCSPTPVEQFNNRVIPELVCKQLYGFIKTLPGVSAADFKTLLKGESVKSSQVYDQWGFCSMQVILVVNMLAGDYQKIFGCESGDINQDAIVLTDRVLLALLPALEASPQSVAAMGRIILSSRKAMMGRSLGHQLEGEAKRNIETRPTNSAYPYINVMDEVGMYFDVSEGPASAQSRSLGFALAYLAQDLPAMGKLSEEVSKTVETVMGNTIIKVAGRIIDEKTRDLYQKLAGEHIVWQRDRIDIETSGMNTISKDNSASYVKENRLDDHELQELREGELFITAVDTFHRVDGPTMVPKSVKVLAVNQFVPWQSYSAESIMRYKLAKLEMKYIYSKATQNDFELEYDNEAFSLVNSILQRVDICRNHAPSLVDSFAFGFASYATMQTDLLSSISGVYDAVSAFEDALDDESQKSVDSNEEDVNEKQLESSSSEEGLQDRGSVTSATENPPEPEPEPEPEPPAEEEVNSYEFEPESEVVETAVTVRKASGLRDTTISFDENDFNDDYLDDNGFEKSASIESSTLTSDKRKQYDSLFNSVLENNAVDKDELTESMSDLNAKVTKITLLDKKVSSGEISKSEANIEKNNPITEVERTVSTERVENMLLGVESSVVHPRLPSPVSDVKRTVAILTKLHKLLESDD